MSQPPGVKSLRSRFEAECPGAYFLQPTASLTRYLKGQAFLYKGEVISSIDKAGEGNMNLTLRVVTNLRSFIIKQARPWVEKFPQLDAPQNRAVTEANFYLLTKDLAPVAERMPQLLTVDHQSHILLIDDLGKGSDYTSLYAGETLGFGDWIALADFLSALHGFYTQEELPNRSLRQLNHAHIFDIPLAPANGLDLDTITPGLAAVAAPLKKNSALRERASELGRSYLADGPTLIHGDFYPGSWLHSPDGLRVIDPEFAHFGRAEFELGVLRAHLILSRQNDTVWNDLFARYRRPSYFETPLMNQFAGMEILRRLIGYAQLPLSVTLAQKKKWLKQSTSFLLD